MTVIEVRGTPAPKGSTRAILIRGRAVNVPGGSNTNRTALQQWAKAVKAAALDACSTVIEGKPVDVEVVFRLARPKGHYAKNGSVRPSAPIAPSVKPDIDKLLRATLDALAGVAYDDDARIIWVSAAKIYAEPGLEGARIAVKERVS